jgi:phosphoribosylformylglycinamidine synthase
LPTPTIGGVGVLDDFRKSASIAFKGEGEAIPAGRRNKGWLGQSLYLRDICGKEEGAPPPVDLAAEKRHGDFVRKAVTAGRISAAHDVSDGGLALGARGNGDRDPASARNSTRARAVPAARLLVRRGPGALCATARAADADTLIAEAKAAGVPVMKIGRPSATRSPCG